MTHGLFAIRAYTAAGTSSEEEESYESDADELSTIPRSWGLPWPAISMDGDAEKSGEEEDLHGLGFRRNLLDRGNQTGRTYVVGRPKCTNT